MRAPRTLLLGVSMSGLLAVGAASVHAAPRPVATGVRAVSAAASSGGQVTVSGWATFSGAVIATGSSPAGNAGPSGGPSGADLTGADVVYRPELADFFIRLKVTAIPTVGVAPAQIVGDPSVLYGLRTAVAGVPIEVRVQSTGAGAQFGLFTCKAETGCLPVATLQGGYGTTGEEIVVSLPLATLVGAGMHIQEGDKIATPIAFTARTPYHAGVIDPALTLDVINMAKTATVTVPAKSVQVTIGKLTKTATLRDGHFTAGFPRSSFTGKTTNVTTRTCLGTTCLVQKFTVDA